MTKLRKNTITFSTETAWGPCNEVFDFIREKFKSLRYYYMSEEGGMGLYVTNDGAGFYYPDRFAVEVYSIQEECLTEYFKNLDDALDWVSIYSGKKITSVEGIKALSKEWQKENKYAYCCLHEYKVVTY